MTLCIADDYRGKDFTPDSYCEHWAWFGLWSKLSFKNIQTRNIKNGENTVRFSLV